MPRTAALVRPATVDEAPALAAIWEELRPSARRPPLRSGQATAVERLRTVVADDASRVMAAEVDGELVGFVVLSCSNLTPLSEAPAVQVSLMVVKGSHRRHGVGRALLSAAVAYADEVGADEVVASVLPTLREANRFYAQLGFAPLVVRRSVPLATLRRRLAPVAERRSLGSLTTSRLGRAAPLRARVARRRARELA